VPSLSNWEADVAPITLFSGSLPYPLSSVLLVLTDVCLTSVRVKVSPRAVTLSSVSPNLRVIVVYTEESLISPRYVTGSIVSQSPLTFLWADLAMRKFGF